jgi:hypothetical protein
MMGLEPTTFCMASGSWVRLFEIAIAVFMWRSMISAHTRCSAGTAGFQGIPSGLGTNVGLVPKRILRRNRLATAECSEWLHILMSVRRRLLRVGLPRALMGRASSNRPSIGLVSTGHARHLSHHARPCGSRARTVPVRASRRSARSGRAHDREDVARGVRTLRRRFAALRHPHDPARVEEHARAPAAALRFRRAGDPSQATDARPPAGE